jgi:serine/threonine protein kinase
MLCIIRKKRRQEKLLDDENLEQDILKRLDKINMKVNSFPHGEIQVKELIGSGEFGQVYCGDWKGTKVALKKLLHFTSHNDKTLNEFFSEISVLRYLQSFAINLNQQFEPYACGSATRNLF